MYSMRNMRTFAFKQAPVFLRAFSTKYIERLQDPKKGFEITQLQDSVKKFIDNHINPYVDEWEKAEQFPGHQVFKKLGEAGFLGIHYPVEYGGQELDYRFAVALAVATGHINCGGIPMAISAHSNMATPALARFGSDELKREFLAPSISGDRIACIGVSEPSAGSDVAGIKMTAKRSGDDYVINGQKMWITSGMQADWMCMLANTSDGSLHESKSLICVPLNQKGVTRSPISKLGMRSSDTALISFEDVRVPAKYLIGEEGQGFLYQMIQFQEERLIGAAISIAPLEKCIQLTIDYTRDRKAFGRSLLDNQVIHFRLAELATELECAKALLEKATDCFVEGRDATFLTSMLKLKVGRLSREIADSCLQYWGGMGFTSEAFVSRLYRDVRVGSIGGGADEVMLGVICKFMGTLPKLKR